MFSFLQKLRYLDWVLFVAIIGISLFGFTALYSIGLGNDTPSFDFLIHQLLIGGIGFVLLFILASMNYRLFRNISVYLYIFSCLLLVVVLFVGHKINGARGWFFIGGIGFEPLELAKLSLILLLARYFSSWTKQVGQLRHIVQSGVLMVIPSGLIMMEPDLGATIILFFIWFCMILMSGIQKRYLLTLITSFVIVASLSWIFALHDYQKQRIITFLSPTSNVSGSGYNVRQALIAIGSGELTGTGVGYGSQSHLKFLPEAQTDFIFSVIAEEFGFIGVFFLLLLWFIVFYRLTIMLKRAYDDFAAYTILGIILMFFSQCVVNIGGNLGLLPLTGLVLPFVSYGGSALLLALVSIGLAQSIWTSRVEFKRIP